MEVRETISCTASLSFSLCRELVIPNSFSNSASVRLWREGEREGEREGGREGGRGGERAICM